MALLSHSMTERTSMRLKAVLLCFSFTAITLHAQVLTSNELSHLRSVESVALSPDGRFVAYTITMRDQPGRPYSQLWVMDLNTQKSLRLGGDQPAGDPLWSGDS